MTNVNDHSMAPSYRVAGLLLFLLSAFLMWQALKLQFYTPVGPGAGFFPVWLAGGLGVLSIIMILQTFIGKQEMVDREEFIPTLAGMLRIVAVVVGLVAFVVLLHPLGFRLSIFLLVLALMFVFGNPGILLSLTVAVGTSLGIYYVFSGLLNIPLPSGWLGF